MTTNSDAFAIIGFFEIIWVGQILFCVHELLGDSEIRKSTIVILVIPGLSILYAIYRVLISIPPTFINIVNNFMKAPW